MTLEPGKGTVTRPEKVEETAEWMQDVVGSQ